MISVVTTVIGFAPPASANEPVIDPECAKYGNPIAILNPSVTTTTTKPEAVTGLSASGLACGTAVTPGGGRCEGKRTLYDSFEVTLAPGAKIEPTVDLPRRSFAGRGQGRALAVLPGCLLGVPPVILEDQSSFEAYPPGSGDCPGGDNEIACLRGYSQTPLGIEYAEQWAWAVEGADGVKLFAGRSNALNGIYDDIGVTHLDVTLCERYGAANQNFGRENCGDADDPPLAYSGYASYPIGCVTHSGPTGEFSLIGTMRNGISTQPAFDCAFWSEPVLPNKAFAKRE